MLGDRSQRVVAIRARGRHPVGLAGLWNTWTDKATGEVVESYTMLTINADAHPLMARMHKPDPKLGPDEQDKRCVVPIEVDDVDEWLFAPIERAKQLVRLPRWSGLPPRPLALLTREDQFDAGPW